MVNLISDHSTQPLNMDWGGKALWKINVYFFKASNLFSFRKQEQKINWCILLIWSCVHFIILSSRNKTRLELSLDLFSIDIYIFIYTFFYKKVVTSIMMTCMVACFSATPSKRKKLLHTDIHWLSESHWAGY